MANTQIIDELEEQIEEQKGFLQSKEWAHFTNFMLRERRPKYQQKLNAAVRTGDLPAAQIAGALMDECENLLKMFVKHVQENEEKLKKEKSNV